MVQWSDNTGELTSLVCRELWQGSWRHKELQAEAEGISTYPPNVIAFEEFEVIGLCVEPLYELLRFFHQLQFQPEVVQNGTFL